MAQLDPQGPTAIPEHPGQPPAVAADVLVLPYNDLAETARLLRRHRDEVGCLIMEPIGSSFGYVPAQPEFLQGVRKLTEELGIVLVFVLRLASDRRVMGDARNGLFGTVVGIATVLGASMLSIALVVVTLLGL